MSKRRVPGSRRKTSATAVKASGKPGKSSAKNVNKLENKLSGTQKPLRFIGLSLSGGKSDKACVAVIEYYPEHKKIFLSRLYEKIKTEEFISADLKIHEIIAQFQNDIESVIFDAPLTLPKCVHCADHCLGYESCSEPELKWMREFFAKVNKKKKPKKMFTPYTQRPIDAYLAHALEEPFEVQHALGSNQAPLTARALFIRRRLTVPCFETQTRVSLWRIGQDLRVAKSHLRFHKHSFGGDESRKTILHQLVERKGIFIYQQDMKSMVENNHAFEAFLCAYVGYLNYLGQVEERPEDFPAKEAWSLIPKPA